MMKTLGGQLQATDDLGRDRLRRIKLGQFVLATIRLPRNTAMHRKFWKLITVVWQASGVWNSPEDLLIELKFRLGIVRKYTLLASGEIVRIPGSISYASMDQLSFDVFYERAMLQLCELAGGIDSDVLRAEVIQQLGNG